MRKDKFNIIRFESENNGFERYFPKGLEMSGIWYDLIQIDSFKELIKTKLPLGKSRYGGTIVDFPVSLKLPSPKKIHFMAQLDLSECSPLYKSGVLPKKGSLFFFMDCKLDMCQTIFFEGNPSELERNYIEDYQLVWGNINILSGFRAEVQRWEDNYIKLETEELKCTVCRTKNFLDCTCDNSGMLPYSREEIIDRKFICDDTQNLERSKIFGVFADVQLREQEIEAITFSDEVVLFQVGEDINDEGIFSVLINRDDLKHKNISNCRFRWSQT